MNKNLNEGADLVNELLEIITSSSLDVEVITCCFGTVGYKQESQSYRSGCTARFAVRNSDGK